MFELILYNISKSWLLLAAFLILLFIIGCIIYISTKDFKVKNGKIKMYGLLLNMTNKDILIISMIIVRTFLIIYSLIMYEQNLFMYLVMNVIISLLFILFYRKNIIYEIINTIALIMIIYFQDQLASYLVNIEYSSSVQIMRMAVMCFGIVYTVYICLKEFEDVVAGHDSFSVGSGEN